ncbi:MAG TPA: outer membrane beta-barrel protein [Terracidiphilus sp.]|nr:outer membrane beta-barrel protein [Terracidiphilus sp.]
MRRTAWVVWVVLLCAGSVTARAQVAPAATQSRIAVTAGGMGSAFQPDYAGGGIAQASPNRLFGMGAYVDVRFRRWVQLEAEGRWQRLNQFHEIHQDNYLIGPRIPIGTYFGRVTPYGKVLFGMTHMNFEYGEATCTCWTIAYGGGEDVKLNDRWRLRAVDFEYQQLPNWYQLQNSQLHPYGVSMGISYRVF